MDEGAFEYKQNIVLRTDLGMSVGKLISQACHAAVESSEQAKRKKTSVWKRWRDEGARKVILQVNSLEELDELAEKAGDLGIINVIIVDRGLTEIPPGSTTALGVGPDRAELIDEVTGNLKLMR